MDRLTLDAQQRSARLDGQPLSLGARAFDVLSLLQSEAHRIVSKEELLDRVWADRMVEESNLSVQIATLRKALGREAISTVPGVGYKLTLASCETADTPPEVTPLQPPDDKPSLAVLPFANLTGDPERGYLVDGIVNDISSALSRIALFFVTSTTSSFTYKGRVVDLAQIGQELGVRYVLEGSIQQAGDRLRISTQLVECESGHTLWQDRFNGSMANIFDLQDCVSESVAAALEPRLISAEAMRARAKPTENLTAYDLCLRAAPMVHLLPRRETLEEGLALLRQAIDLDPNYTFAKGLYCLGHTGAFATRWWSFEQAEAALPIAQDILGSGTDDPLALTYAGHYMAYIGNNPQLGLTALDRAKILNPNSATIAMMRGWVHIYLGQADAAIEELQRVRRISPLHPHIGVATSGLGHAQMMKGDPAGAALLFEQALTEYPEFATAHIGLMAAYWALGRTEEARNIAAVLLAKSPDMTISSYVHARRVESDAMQRSVVDAMENLGFPA